VCKHQDVRLLIVDDDSDFRSTLVRRFTRRGYHIHEAANGETALELAASHQFDVAILDMVMPGMSGIEVLEKLKADNNEVEAIILTGQSSVDTAVQAMKLGAYDYLSKPCALAELEVLIEKAFERRQLAKENLQLRTVIRRAQPDSKMIGQSPAMLEVFRVIERAAPTHNSILIQGESGTGKELVARALHQSSNLADKPLVVINCAALPETLLESELFGHEKGSFTGAISAKPGLFEVADGGTLFIDEIGELAGPLQAKLLRVLEDGTLRRIGSIKERHVKVRLIAATNRNLSEDVETGRFREDLFYRINVMTLELPPVRNRHGDVPLLVERFLGQGWQIEPAALDVMRNFKWPGNVRQIINAIERAKIMSDDHTVRMTDLPPDVLRQGPTAPARDRSQAEDLATIERAHIVEMLRREGGNKARTARALGVTRRTLYRLLEKYDVRTNDGEVQVS